MRRPDAFTQWINQHAGAFTRAAALHCGISPKRFRVGVANQEFVPIRGVWRLADYPPSQATHVWAVLLRSGDGARISGPTTLWFHQLKVETSLIYVSVPEGRHPRHDGVVTIRDRSRPSGGTYLERIPSVTRARAIVDSLRLLDRSQSRAVLHEALRRGWIDNADLDEWCRLLQGHRGIAQLRMHTKYARSGVQAESEYLLLRLMRAARLKGWTFNREIRDADGTLIGVGDCVNEQKRIVIEVDGFAWHSTDARFEGDRFRQNRLMNGDWLVLRFTWAHLTEQPEMVVATVKTAMDQRSRR